MNIYLKHYRIPIHVLLKNAGYQYRKNKNDFIKESVNGRFHIKFSEEHYGCVKIHFDLYIENRHVVFDLPITLGKEKGRILGVNKKYKNKNETKKKII